ncbi:MAG: type II toxin-antitoxin system HicB family antitoxin [Pedosphaera sp.]|nr:type II toxin-antitoxin system HicB family antitoxin [Pedosphaera sp.]
MLTEYIQRAMRHGKYEIIEDGRFFGCIPDCQGAWGEGPTLEECRDDLQGALESWILVRLRRGDPMPVIDGLDLNLSTTAYAEADQAP